MKRYRFATKSLLAAAIALALPVEAELVDNGDGTVTDTDTGLMWLQDAGASGWRSWDEAQAWAENLEFAGYDDWRLPSAGLTDTGGLYEPSGCATVAGTCNSGWNIVRDSAELAKLYNDTLGNPSSLGSSGWTWPGNAGPFTNIQADYWLADEYAPRTTNAWRFYAYQGMQTSARKRFGKFAWAVREVSTEIIVAIDIKPDSDSNSVNPRSKGKIPVAILGGPEFDATQADAATVRFGSGEAAPAHDGGHVEDVNEDGFPDLLLHFPTQDAGIACEDASASLSGQTFAGQAFSGSDALSPTGCKK